MLVAVGSATAAACVVTFVVVSTVVKAKPTSGSCVSGAGVKVSVTVPTAVVVSLVKFNGCAGGPAAVNAGIEALRSAALGPKAFSAITLA
jgi:hypothetical protein